MKISDVRAKTADQLKTELLDLKKEQFNFRFQKATGQLENTGRVRAVRRSIARIKTVQQEQQSGVQPAVKKATKAAKPAAKTAAKKKETQE